MITLNRENFEKFRPLLSVPAIHALPEKPVGDPPPPCTCSKEHGVTLVYTAILGNKETGPTKDIHVCDACNCVYKDNAQTPVYESPDAHLDGMVRKYGTVHVFFTANAKKLGYLTTAMQAIHDAVNQTQLQESN